VALIVKFSWRLLFIDGEPHLNALISVNHKTSNNHSYYQSNVASWCLWYIAWSLNKGVSKRMEIWWGNWD